MAAEALEELEGVALVGAHEEHEVCVERAVKEPDRHGHCREQGKAARKRARLRVHVAAEGQRKGIEREQEMHGEAVEHHEVERRQRGPRREEQGRAGGGQADEIQKGVEQLRPPPGVQGDEKDIDGAQVQRQVIEAEIAAVKKAEVLEELVRDEQQRDGAPPAASLVRVHAAIAAAEHGAEQKKNGEHGEVEGTEMRPAEARRDGVNGFPEIGHSTAICLSLRLLNSTP